LNLKINPPSVSVFLLCFQANTTNVLIKEDGELDKGMDKFGLELLSTRRHFEHLMEYTAPSSSQT